MPITKTAGVVIKAQDYREADRLLVLYTERLGKVRARVRGVRKIKSKLAGKLEIPSLAEFSLHARKEGDFFLVTGVKAVNGYHRLKEELERWLTTCYCLELLEEMSVEHDCQPDSWNLLLEMLDALERGAPVSAVGRGFEQKMLVASGYGLELDNCAACNGKLSDDSYGFDPEHSGILCRSCARRGASRLSLGGNAINWMKCLREQSMLDYGAELEEKVDAELQAVGRLCLGDIIERELKSDKVIREMRGGSRKSVVGSRKMRT